MTYDIEIEEYGVDDHDNTYCVILNGSVVAGPFGSRQEAQAWIDAQ